MAEGGLSYNFQLSVVWSERQWDLYISSVKTVQAHKEKEMFLPLWTFPWLRQQMAKMLAKLDGNEGIAKMPKIPEWATRGFSNSTFHQILLSLNQLYQKLSNKSSNLMRRKNR
jgi:hypothetical protein